MVIDTVTSLRGIPRNSVSMSASEEIATPHLPTSARARSGGRNQKPISVGRSKATDKPA